ncbi:unknown [Mycoplasma sp. CAG:776]|nr:unknown [Mycoplasma sp. CAG:776]
MNNKIKVAVYLRINSNNEKEMEKEVERVKRFCNYNDLEIVEITKDYIDNSQVEEVFDKILRNSEIYTLVTNKLSMLSDNIYELYDYYVYLNDYCHCNLVSVEKLDNYRFEIKLVKEGHCNA